MLKAYKKNRVVRISDEKKAEYQVLGYKITDMEGKVIYDPAAQVKVEVKEPEQPAAEPEKDAEPVKAPAKKAAKK